MRGALTERQISLWTDIVSVDSTVSANSKKAKSDKDFSQKQKACKCNKRIILEAIAVSVQFILNSLYYVSGNISFILWREEAHDCLTYGCNCQCICTNDIKYEIFARVCLMFNHILTPTIIILLLNIPSTFNIYNELQSWEIAFFVWTFCIVCYEFFILTLPLIYISKATDYSENKTNKEIAKWIFIGDTYLLLPFGIRLSRIKEFNNDSVYWPIVLVSMFPSAIAGMFN